jgi:GNAT superfamily N-acetyltransferase
MSESEYIIAERAPTLEEYHTICTAVGWAGVINFDAAAEALPRSLYAVVALHAGQAIGMGRIVGDGAIFFYLQDIAVLPAHQGAGLGGRIVGRLLEYVARAAPPQAFVGLFAAAGKEPFYQRYGFQAHAGLTGMFQVTPLGARPADR